MILRLVLGALFAAMGAGQLASFGAMPGILDAYRLTSGAGSAALAAAVIAGEASAGAWFLARPRSSARTPVWIFTGVNLVWATLAVQAYARGLAVDNCGCFGRYAAQPLRWWVLAEDALMLLYAWLLLRRKRSSQVPPPASGGPRIPSSAIRVGHTSQGKQGQD
ncbi:MauE/DoxX family redox-associated membrane protein [Streptomyces ardesiacus]|uniref:MauE/DoxX family redox-associated membrane protein n=1 Tax=Streptomyces ardesiacus TaxID=285564 RepID=UPI0006E2E742|nr:MauE/DoxX family redox-associated membrane protein [Streptomyces sp. NBRC 110030]